jgi:hypothetical protein
LLAYFATGAAATVTDTIPRFVAAIEEDTVRTVLFGHGWPHAPHRTLRTRFVREWVDRESETQDSRFDEPIIGRTFISGAEIPIQMDPKDSAFVPLKKQYQCLQPKN